MKPLRICVDTSIIGGCFDDEFAEDSRAVIRLASQGTAVLLVSDVLVRELMGAPRHIRDLLASLPPTSIERIEAEREAFDLQEAYLDAGVVAETSARDALNVATATVARADMIVSWNFKHIVHYEKIRAFNAVNHRAGYPMVAIHSPKEVV